MDNSSEGLRSRNELTESNVLKSFNLRIERLELSLIFELEPKPNVSANFTISADRGRRDLNPRPLA